MQVEIKTYKKKIKSLQKELAETKKLLEGKNLALRELFNQIGQKNVKGKLKLKKWLNL